MMQPYEQQPLARPVDVTLTLPGSKSLTNRAMITAALAQGTSVLNGVLFANDTWHMITALQKLGFAITTDPPAARVEVTGRGGFVPSDGAVLACGNSGTTIRFCTALASLGMGQFRLDGVPRMRQRPIGGLVDALRTMGASIEYAGAEGFPPVIVHGQGLRGGEVHLDRPVSSQFVSALLLVAPACASDVMIEVQGPLVSAFYVSMTTRLMERFGPSVIERIDADQARFIIPARQPYTARNDTIEPDASNASYFLAAPLLTGGRVTIMRLGADSLQGDVRFVDVLASMGANVEREGQRTTVRGPADGRVRAVDVDLNAMPDMVPTLAVLALFADGPTRIRNVGNLRIKETDRLAALASELRRLGARVDEHDDGLLIEPLTSGAGAGQRDDLGHHLRDGAIVRTYDDHRMAMAFALAGLRVAGLRIENPDCVAKTFPRFFTAWQKLRDSTDV